LILNIFPVVKEDFESSGFSSLEKGSNKIPVPPFLRGARGDLHLEQGL
jgi:hypothetical protein